MKKASFPAAAAAVVVLYYICCEGKWEMGSSDDWGKRNRQRGPPAPPPAPPPVQPALQYYTTSNYLQLLLLTQLFTDGVN